LQTIIQEATPGELIGPLKVGGGWCLLRVEDVLPPRFEEQLKKELEEQLFASWLAEKVTRLNVELLPMKNIINDS
jgi:parvulin-like peptidyl-prolyl isomerase